jgi:hypothetical protein
MAIGLTSQAAHAEDVIPVPSQVVIVTPLSLVSSGSLDFGTILSPNGSGTVVLVPGITSTCSTTGGLVRTGNCQAATFWGLGTTNQVVRLRFPNDRDVTLTNQADATKTMEVTNLIFDSGTGLTYVSGNLNANGFVRHRIAAASGIFSFRVGGTLHVASAQAAGRYVGTFSVTVDYQ